MKETKELKALYPPCNFPVEPVFSLFVTPIISQFIRFETGCAYFFFKHVIFMEGMKIFSKTY